MRHDTNRTEASISAAERHSESVTLENADLIADSVGHDGFRELRAVTDRGQEGLDQLREMMEQACGPMSEKPMAFGPTAFPVIAGLLMDCGFRVYWECEVCAGEGSRH